MKNPTVSKRNPTAQKVVVPGLWDDPEENNGLTLEGAFKAYSSAISGRDKSAVQRCEFWVQTLGASTLLSKIGKTQVQRVLRAMTVQGPTKNRYCSALSAIYMHAAEQLNWEGENPARGWRKWPENDCHQTALDESEIQRLLAASLVCSWPKMRLFVLMAIVTGLRRSNLCEMRYQDVDQDGRTKVGRTKNGTPFVAVMTKELSAEFKRFAETANPEHLIFSGPNPKLANQPFCLDKKFRETVKRAGLDRPINIHTLRHTCASILASKGASTIEIMEFMNHRTPSMAARYTHLNVQHRQKRAEELLSGLMDQREAANSLATSLDSRSAA